MSERQTNIASPVTARDRSGTRLIEVRVAELKQLFNPMDPSPFQQRDLDPDAEEYIVSSGRELPRDARLELLVHLDRSPGDRDETAILEKAVHGFFEERAAVTRRRLKRLFGVGRVSLVIGLASLAGALTSSHLVERFLSSYEYTFLLSESLLIGGWVAMWRPIEIFLYDWWPIRADARLFDRLATMPVRIAYSSAASEARPRDWPEQR